MRRVAWSQSLGLGADVQPELDDLKLFEQDNEHDEDGTPAKTLTHMTSVHKRMVVLKKGDVVRVKTGELRDLLGDVDSIQGKVVVIRPRHDAIKSKLEFSKDELEKYFETGDHVKVVSGRRAGVTGTVVKVDGEIIQVGPCLLSRAGALPSRARVCVCVCVQMRFCFCFWSPFD